MSNYKEIEEAKATLRKHGYQVYNLWHIDLIDALQNEATMTQIWFAIDFHAEFNGLELKEEEE
jgi:hypothetical protein